MDLSKLKWVVIIGIVVGGGWLVTGSGVDWVYDNATKATPGEDETQDKVDEATLSKYGGFLMSTFQPEKAKRFYGTAIARYDDTGANYWWNTYQLARAEENLENWDEAVDILIFLWEEDADQYDERVPDQRTLKLRLDKLIELHELEPVGR